MSERLLVTFKYLGEEPKEAAYYNGIKADGVRSKNFGANGKNFCAGWI